MQHDVSVLHGANGRIRFVLPGSQHRGPRSGLLRVFRTPGTQAAAARRQASRQPVRAIHAATRSASLPIVSRPPTVEALAPAVDSIRWSAPRPWAGRARGTAPTPGRG